MEREQASLVNAVASGDPETVASLLQASGANVQDLTLVLLAIQHNHVQVLDVLLTHGIPSQDQDHVDGRRGRSPLCLAIELGHVECTRVLLAHGASADAPSVADGSLHTPLHVAAMFDSGFDELIASTTMLDARDLHENTPLHLAAAYGSDRIARVLLEERACSNAVNAAGSTPLHLASSNGFASIAELLLDHGADVNAQDVLGNTPLIDAAFVNQSAAGHFACGDAASQSRVIQLLLARGADVNACNRDYNTAICGAVRHGYTDAVLALLDHGASVDVRNRSHESVLHVAARAGVASVQIWKRLLIAGADVLARDRYDRTCYCIWTSRPKPTADAQPEDEDEPLDSTTRDDDSITCVLEAAIMAR